MADKYIKLDSGRLKQQEAATTSAGAGDSGKIVALNTSGKLDDTMMPAGVGDEVKSLTASEDLSAGNFVNIYDDGGTTKVRKADATTEGKEAYGFVLAGATSGSSASVYVTGVNDQLTGLTGGTRYYLDTTAGGITDTPPSGSNNVVQCLGVAISTTELSFIPTAPVTVA